MNTHENQISLSAVIRTLDADLVEQIIAASADATQQFSDGVTPLTYASQQHDTRIARILLESGADVDAVRMLTAHGADPGLPAAVIAPAGRHATAMR